MTNPMAMTQQFETKHTPIGKIPAEWSYVTIGMIAKVCAGGTPSREVPDYWNGTIPWMGTGKIDFRTIREPKEHITEAGLAASSTRLFPVGTLLIAMIGQGDTRGKVAVLGIACCVNQNCAAIVPTQGDSSEYLFHFLVHNYRRTRAIGNAGGVGNMNAAMVRGIGIPLPPLPEQRKIAEVLSTWDRAIEQTEKLVAAKERLKKGLMQRLLTGQLRFPEFEGTPWRTCRLGEVARECRERNTDGGIGGEALLGVSKTDGMVSMRDRVRGDSTRRCRIVRTDWFAYNPMRLNIGSIARWTGESSVLVSGDYIVFRCLADKLVPDYLHHYRQSHRWERFVQAEGSGNVRVRIYSRDLARLRLPLPSLAEQQRIANALNACDDELIRLRQQLNALRQQKKGLMQKLLTGRIRVRICKEDGGGVRRTVWKCLCSMPSPLCLGLVPDRPSSALQAEVCAQLQRARRASAARRPPQPPRPAATASVGQAWDEPSVFSPDPASLPALKRRDSLPPEGRDSDRFPCCGGDRGHDGDPPPQCGRRLGRRPGNAAVQERRADPLRHHLVDLAAHLVRLQLPVPRPEGHHAARPGRLREAGSQLGASTPQKSAGKEKRETARTEQHRAFP